MDGLQQSLAAMPYGAESQRLRGAESCNRCCPECQLEFSLTAYYPMFAVYVVAPGRSPRPLGQFRVFLVLRPYLPSILCGIGCALLLPVHFAWQPRCCVARCPDVASPYHGHSLATAPVVSSARFASAGAPRPSVVATSSAALPALSVLSVLRLSGSSFPRAFRLDRCCVSGYAL